MDPLAIAAGSASLAILCVKVFAFLYARIADAKNIDTTVRSLCDETMTLSRVLDAISKAWE
jgi:hypothetical protein